MFDHFYAGMMQGLDKTASGSSDPFFSGLADGFEKVAKEERKKPSKSHSLGMLGALAAAGYGGYKGYKRGFFGMGGPKTRGTHALLNAAAAAPLGYIAARGAGSILRRTSKHAKNIASKD